MRGWEMLDMRLSVAPKIHDAAASDLDEIVHAASGRRLLNEVEVGVLVPLTLPNGGFDGRR